MKIINCAHRGSSAYAPENTRAAFELAIEQGASMIELDIQQTADDQLVLFHDEDLGRTSSGTGPLWKQDLANLRKLDVGHWFDARFGGEKILSLEETISDFANRVTLNVELKIHGRERDLEEVLVEKISGIENIGNCLFTSFGHDTIDRLRNIDPTLRLGYIVGKGQWQDGFLERKINVLCLERTLATADRMRLIHSAGKKVFVWTVNEKSEMVEKIQAGADAIISNFPDRLAEVLDKF
ncbi:MAG: hypothetical protein GY780_16400 [bacterium]|nr:hypothetical protein [bacterium]